jgi:predicted secreted Zn-dependent protease
VDEILSASGDLNWHVSRTCDGGACVKVASHGDLVVFGNTTQPGGPVYTYTKTEWIDFVAGVKQGDFDGVV